MVEEIREREDFSPEQKSAYRSIEAILRYIGDSVVGQHKLCESILIALLCRQHILIEGTPGLAKTLTVTRFAEALNIEYKRIQFTPDLLPSDLIGTLIFNPKEGSFTTKKGPLFTSILLADEINRAPAKVQSALLEAMQERQVTIDAVSYPLPSPFMVLATQNPIDQEGTYPLPEAQIDRFMMQVNLTYPTREEELVILNRYGIPHQFNEPSPSLEYADLELLWKMMDRVHVSDTIKEYIVSLVHATRNPEDFGLDLKEYIRFGATPRATIVLVQAGRAHAFLHGEDYVSPHNIKMVASDVLRHRLVLSFEAKADGVLVEDIINAILERVPLQNPSTL